MTGRAGDWGLRFGAVLLLVLVHIGIWRPARDVLTDAVVYPIAEAIDTSRSRSVDLSKEPRAVRAEADGRVYRFHLPAALSYLAVAAVLIAVWPRRLYWLALWGAHLALGAVAYGTFLAGVGWTSTGFAVSEFVQLYLVPAIEIGALLAASLPGWLRESR